MSMYQKKYHLIELELNSILEITQVINNNAPEDSLYKMYKFTLQGNLQVEKLALYVYEDDESQWYCKVDFGTNLDFSSIELEAEALSEVRDISPVEYVDFSSDAFNEFDVIIPVFHKDKVLAYVFLDSNESDSELNDVDTRFVQTLSNIIIVAIENKKLVRKQIKQETFQKELDIAKQVQSMLFPKTLPKTKSLQIEATYFPHQIVGGDYYDYIPISEDEFVLCIADVSGKGVPAALLMSNFQASLRTLTRQTNNLEQIIAELNSLIWDNAQGDHFITFFIGLFNRTEHTFHYINAGHNPAFLFYNGKAEQLHSGTTILGIFDPLPFINQKVIENVEEFLLFCYTDGITETTNPEGEEFGIDRLMEFVQQNNDLSVTNIHNNLIREIQMFKQENQYSDDITLLSCRYIQSGEQEEDDELNTLEN